MSNGDVTTTTEVLTSSPTTTPTSTASETSNPAMTKQSVSTETLVDTSHCNRCRNWWVVLGVAIEIRLGRERLAINKLICYIYKTLHKSYFIDAVNSLITISVKAGWCARRITNFVKFYYFVNQFANGYLQISSHSESRWTCCPVDVLSSLDFPITSTVVFNLL